MNKIIFIIIDGLADDASEKNQTPVEMANAPTIHNIAKKSKPLLLKTIYRFLPIGSIVANLGILGYNPYEYFPYGRSFYELLAKYDKEKLEPTDLILRCNTISISENQHISDFTAKQVDDNIANMYILHQNKHLPKNYKIIHGKSYRNSLIIKNCYLKPDDLICFEPHTRIGESIRKYLIIHSTKTISKIKQAEINKLNSTMLNSIKISKDFNSKYHSNINMIWFWEPSIKNNLPNFTKKFKFSKPYLITGSDFLIGIANCAKINCIDNIKYTGEFNTDYKGKGEESIAALKNNCDFLYVHINATDEEAHQKKFHRKRKAIELIDKNIVKPIFNYIKNKSNFKLIICGDHYTSSKSGNHLELDSPAIIYNTNTQYFYSPLDKFSEKEIILHSPKIIKSYNLIRYLSKNEI